MYQNFKRYCFVFLSLLLLTFPLLSDPLKSFEDRGGNKCTVKVIGSDSFKEEKDALKTVFVNSFHTNYSQFEPSHIKPHFKSHDDTKTWIASVFEREVDDTQKASHPLHWIGVYRNTDLVGFGIFEQWNNKAKTWHVRQLAIASEAQKMGYGKELLFSITISHPEIEKLVLDTRSLNGQARHAYKTWGATELDSPNDAELDSTAYIGLEFKIKTDSKQ